MKVLDNTEDSELEICVKKDNEKLEKGILLVEKNVETCYNV
jgi:hypothetical protein